MLIIYLKISLIFKDQHFQKIILLYGKKLQIQNVVLKKGKT